MARKLTSLNRDELDALAESNGVTVEEDDTAHSLIDKLEAKGVTEAPSQADADEAEEPKVEQGATNPLPRSTPPELPDLDPATKAGVTPLPATAVNPGLSYDDDAAGKPEDDPDAQPEMR